MTLLCLSIGKIFLVPYTICFLTVLYIYCVCVFGRVKMLASSQLKYHTLYGRRFKLWAGFGIRMWRELGLGPISIYDWTDISILFFFIQFRAQAPCGDTRSRSRLHRVVLVASIHKAKFETLRIIAFCWNETNRCVYVCVL